MTPEEKA
jgi:hypothetical protein